MFTTRKALTFLCVLVAASTAGCFESKTVVTRVRPHVAGQPRPKMNGVMFALPRTVVRADVPVLRERLAAGQFYFLSPFFYPGERFVAASPVPSPAPAASDPAGTSFSIEEPKFGVRGKADPDETFIVSIRGGRFETKTLLLDVTEEGIVAKAEAESKDETIDFVTEGIKTAASIALPLLADAGDAGGINPQLAAEVARIARVMSDPAAEDNPERLRQLRDQNRVRFEEVFLRGLTPREQLIYASLPREYQDFLLFEVNFAYLLQLSEDERRFFWTISKAQRDYFRSLTAAQKAELPRAKVAYDRIQEFAKRREELAKSEPQPGSPPETLAAKLKEIDDYIKSFKQNYFTGGKSTSTWTGNFEFDPKPSVLEVRLFDYSEKDGICAPITNGVGNKTIKPAPGFLFKQTAANPTCDDPRGVILRLDVPAEQLASFLDSTSARHANFDDSGQRGFYYRVPARVTALLLEESQVPQQVDPTSATAAVQGTGFRRDEIARDIIAVAQLGQTASLPASTGGRRSSYKLIYYDATGAVRTFNIGSDALIQKSNAEDVAGTLTEIRDAELNGLKRDTERLKAEKDKIEAQNALKKAKEANANSNANTSTNNN